MDPDAGGTTLLDPLAAPPAIDPALIRTLFDQLVDTTASVQARLGVFKELAAHGAVETLAPVLPCLLTHEGKPFTLDKHYQFETVFRTRRPSSLILMTARQCGKTSSEAADSVAMSASIPRFKQLFVTPLFEQARRLSNNHVRDLIDNSPVRSLLVSSTTDKSVLQKTFNNHSMIQFTYGVESADRARGISSDFVRHDEVQDSNSDTFPIIHESMSHSPWELLQFAGTPKTPENVLTGLWLESSQAEWFVPCSCGKDNIPAVEFDLEKMIGPWRADISAERPGLVCAACGKPVDARQGFWKHRRPELRWHKAGYHVSQPIMAIHYSSPEKWATLLAKRQGADGYTPDKYFNEVLGAPCGSGSQLVSRAELQAAATLPFVNTPNQLAPSPHVLDRLEQYRYRILAVDWGGGGKRLVSGKTHPVSLTALAVLGWHTSGVVHVLWGKRLMTPHDHMLEARDCHETYKRFRCHLIAHDYTGAGDVRETVLVQNKVPLERLMPIAYRGASSGGLLSYEAPTEFHPRKHWSVDKSYSLQLTCSAIRSRKVRFFKYDWVSPRDRGLIEDFLGLVEEKVSTRSAGDTYTISRHFRLSDDFAQAVNIGCVALWSITKAWPALSAGIQRKVARTPVQIEAYSGPGGNGFTEADATVQPRRSR